MVKRRKTWSKHADELMQSAMVACWPLNLLFTPVHFLLMMANCHGFQAPETDASLYWTCCCFHMLQGILLMQGSPNVRRPDSAFWSRIWSALWWLWLLLSLYPAGCILAGLSPKPLPHKRGPAVMAGGVWRKWQWQNANLMSGSARERDATREEPVRRSDFRIPEHALLYLGQRGVAPGVLDLIAPHFPTFENGNLDIKGLGLKAVAPDAFRPKTAAGTRAQDGLADLWLSFNELSELPKNVFAGLPRLPVRERKEGREGQKDRQRQTDRQTDRHRETE